MKAVNECIHNVNNKSTREHEEYVEMVLTQNLEGVKQAIEFDDDLFRFGGDIELTDEEKKIKVMMHKMKEDYESKKSTSESKTASPPAGDQMRLGKELEAKIEELKQSRNENFLIFGVLFMIMLVFSVVICKKGLSDGGITGNNQMAKDVEYITIEKLKLENWKKKLQAMEQALVIKMDGVEEEEGSSKEDIEAVNGDAEEEEVKQRKD